MPKLKAQFKGDRSRCVFRINMDIVAVADNDQRKIRTEFESLVEDSLFILSDVVKKTKQRG